MQHDRPLLYGQLVSDLCQRSDEIVESLVEAAAGAVPAAYTERVKRECRPMVETWLPICLEHLRQGTRPTPDELRSVTQVSRERDREGRPLVVALAAVGGAIGCFGGIVARSAGDGRAAALPALLSASAAITHDFIRALHAGRASSRRDRPEWMDRVPPQHRLLLQLAAEGSSTAQMARLTGYSVHAISAHLSALMRVAGVRNRTALVAMAIQQGLVRLEDRHLGEQASHAS